MVLGKCILLVVLEFDLRLRKLGSGVSWGVEMGMFVKCVTDLWFWSCALELVSLLLCWTELMLMSFARQR